MRYKCSYCHTIIETEGDSAPDRCPHCQAEIGLEIQKPPALAMRLFGVLLAGVLLAVLAGGVVSRMGG